MERVFVCENSGWTDVFLVMRHPLLQPLHCHFWHFPPHLLDPPSTFTASAPVPTSIHIPGVIHSPTAQWSSVDLCLQGLLLWRKIVCLTFFNFLACWTQGVLPHLPTWLSMQSQATQGIWPSSSILHLQAALDHNDQGLISQGLAMAQLQVLVATQHRYLSAFFPLHNFCFFNFHFNLVQRKEKGNMGKLSGNN